MTIDVDKINPMDWHGTKLVPFIPPHFVKVKFEFSHDRKRVLDWVQENVSGRFGFEEIIDPDERHTFIVNEKYHIGFENPADATMFTMFFR